MRPKLFVNYTKYTLFISMIAHEYKRLGFSNFMNKYENHRYRGIYKCYLDSYIEYKNNIFNNTFVTCETMPKKVIVDPFVYKMYYRYNKKSILSEVVNNAIPEFLKRGILITEVQEAVNASKSDSLFKKS